MKIRNSFYKCDGVNCGKELKNSNEMIRINIPWQEPFSYEHKTKHLCLDCFIKLKSIVNIDHIQIDKESEE